MNETNSVLKGAASTAGVFGAGIAAWLPIADLFLKIGIELFGLYAGFYAARYWHYKWANRKKRSLKDPDTDLV